MGTPKLVRPPAVAGRFYPGTAADVQKALSALLPPPKEPPRAAAMVLCPHAGWIYSGRICGATLSAVQVPNRAVLLGPNHTGLGAPVSLWNGGPWRIPGAEVSVDTDLVHNLAATGSFQPDAEAHRFEHCLEVIVPMLWARNPEVSIAPVVLGPLSLEACLHLGETVAQVIRAASDPVLIVVSSDMSHYIPAEAARRLDALALAQVEAADPAGLYETVTRHGIGMCGYVPATVGLAAARRLGARRGHVVGYANSGETSGDFERVVGYAGAYVE